MAVEQPDTGMPFLLSEGSCRGYAFNRLESRFFGQTFFHFASMFGSFLSGRAIL
jgi:hypothetical protein